MALGLQPETEIAADGSASVVYVGDWTEALPLVAACAVSRSAAGVYSYATFTPGATLSSAPTATTASPGEDGLIDWGAAQTALGTALAATGARLRAMAGGLGRLTITATTAPGLRKAMEAAVATDATATPAGRRAWSFGVAETPRSILADETTEIQEHVNAWMIAPTALRARFLYVNASTGENAALTSAEKALAVQILAGNDTLYSYNPTVTLAISGAAADPDDLPTIGATTAPPAGAVNIRLPAGTWSWRVVVSGSALGEDGTWSATVTWQAEEVEA